MGHGEGVEILEELEIHHEDQEVAKVGMMEEVEEDTEVPLLEEVFCSFQ
jgi:hypothetical protein